MSVHYIRRAGRSRCHTGYYAGFMNPRTSPLISGEVVATTHQILRLRPLIRTYSGHHHLTTEPFFLQLQQEMSGPDAAKLAIETMASFTLRVTIISGSPHRPHYPFTLHFPIICPVSLTGHLRKKTMRVITVFVLCMTISCWSRSSYGLASSVNSPASATQESKNHIGAGAEKS